MWNVPFDCPSHGGVGGSWALAGVDARGFSSDGSIVPENIDLAEGSRADTWMRQNARGFGVALGGSPREISGDPNVPTSEGQQFVRDVQLREEELREYFRERMRTD